MIASKHKWRKSTLIAVLLVAALAVGCTFTASQEEAEGYGEKEDLKMAEFAGDWATAFSDRDAEKIRGMSINEELYLNIGYKEADGTLWMGMSSPWPWLKDHVIELVEGRNEDMANIYYYFRTSDPNIYVGKQTITVGEVDGEYKVIEESMVQYDRISSKADFDDAFKPGFPDFSGVIAEAYQRQVDANLNGTAKEIFEHPIKAVMHQLNLSEEGLQYIRVLGGDPESGYFPANAVLATIVFSDGEVTVPLIRPMVKDEKGVEKQGTVWIVVDENQLSSN